MKKSVSVLGLFLAMAVMNSGNVSASNETKLNGVWALNDLFCRGPKSHRADLAKEKKDMKYQTVLMIQGTRGTLTAYDMECASVDHGTVARDGSQLTFTPDQRGDQFELLDGDLLDGHHCQTQPQRPTTFTVKGNDLEFFEMGTGCDDMKVFMILRRI